MATDNDAPCFMCDPSILEGARCATGFPLCDTHREELTGNLNPALKRYQTENARLAAEIEGLERRVEVAEAVAQMAAHDRDEALENFARVEQEYAAAVLPERCRCGRPAFYSFTQPDPRCPGCEYMAAATCDCAPV